jgi:hypothetical protein
VPIRLGLVPVATILFLAGGYTRLPGQTPDLVVHEWGTFTSIAGADGRAIEWLALDGPADLPCFVERTPGILKTRLPATIRMETPVLYFYAAREARVEVRVGFERGVITEHYPRGSVASIGLDQTTLKRPGLASRITWRDVRILPDAPADFRTERAPNHYYAARNTDAAPVEVGAQRERFLFYRGLGGFAAPVGATTGRGDEIAIATLTNHDIPALLLFENRGGRIGHRVHDRPMRELRLAPPTLDGNVESTRRVLERMLVAKGLYPKEAAAMVETWRDSWFEEGSRLLYIVPAPVVEAVLPLRIDPAPQRVVRVFVGRLELGTSATLSDISTAARTGDPSIEQRYGRFLRPFAERLLAQNLSPSDRARVERLTKRATTSAEPIPSTCP